MEKGKQQIAAGILTFLLVIIIAGCANQLSPPGGDVDEIPPTIIETYPENYTVNFDENEIEFTFSEYVNKRNINEAFFISPLIDGFPIFSWTNKTVYVEFPDSLKQNTTYSVVMGTEITDFNNNNNMSQPFILTFSTGPTIDSGKISGKVYSENSKGTMIFAYKNEPGFIDIYKNKPNYLSQIDKSGYYEISGLAPGEYKIFAVKDEFKDFLYDIGSDLIGLPFRSVSISDEQLSFEGLNFKLMREDTLSPNIQNVTMTDENHLVVEFDEPVDSSKLSADLFLIIDSTAAEEHPIRYWFRTNPGKNEYILSFTDSLLIDNENYLIVKNLKDKTGNTNEYQTFPFTPSDKPDTNAVSFIKILTPFEGEKIDFIKPEFSILFNDGFDSLNIDQAVKMFDQDSNSIPLFYNQINNSEISLKSQNDLKPKTKYSIQLNMKFLEDAAGNKVDTIIYKNITTLNDLDFSGAKGKINSSVKNIRVVLESIGRNKRSYEMAADINSGFDFDRIIPGEYLIWAYEDKDTSGKYSSGKVNPFEFSEFFNYYPDTLNLRARWPVGDIFIDFNNK